MEHLRHTRFWAKHLAHGPVPLTFPMAHEAGSHLFTEDKIEVRGDQLARGHTASRLRIRPGLSALGQGLFSSCFYHLDRD